MIRRTSRPRSAAAAVEAAFVMPVLLIILAGLWEVGRIIQVQQVVSNSSREAARLAAQGETINLNGSPTQIQVSTGTPNLKATVVNYLKQANLNVTAADVTVEFAFTNGDTTLTQPYQGLKGQQFRVTVKVPVSKVQWSLLSLTGVTTIESTVYWCCLTDDPFSINTTLPSW